MRIPDKISDDSTKKGNANHSTREKCSKDKRITNIKDMRQLRVQSQEKAMHYERVKEKHKARV